MFLNANFQLVTNSIENEITAGGHISQFVHGEGAVTDDQMTFQDCVSLRVGILVRSKIPHANQENHSRGTGIQA